MEESQRKKKAEKAIQLDPEDEEHGRLVESFVHKAQDYFREKGWEDCCRITARRENTYFILEGWVTSQRIKTRLFSMVPEIKGAQWIQDRVEVRADRRNDSRD